MQAMSTKPRKLSAVFVVAGCEPATVLHLVEALLDHVSQGGDGHVDALANLPVLAHR